jgi:hypothetical protein
MTVFDPPLPPAPVGPAWPSGQLPAPPAPPNHTRRNALICAGALVTLAAAAGAFALTRPAAQKATATVPTHQALATPTPLSSDVGPLVAANNAECADLGRQVVRYLQTGDNESDPDLDQQFAMERATILSAPTDARPALIRVAADSAIMACDERIDALLPRQRLYEAIDFPNELAGMTRVSSPELEEALANPDPEMFDGTTAVAAYGTDGVPEAFAFVGRSSKTIDEEASGRNFVDGFASGGGTMSAPVGYDADGTSFTCGTFRTEDGAYGAYCYWFDAGLFGVYVNATGGSEAGALAATRDLRAAL